MAKTVAAGHRVATSSASGPKNDSRRPDPFNGSLQRLHRNPRPQQSACHTALTERGIQSFERKSVLFVGGTGQDDASPIRLVLPRARARPTLRLTKDVRTRRASR